MSRASYPRIGSSRKVKSWANMPEKARPLCCAMGCTAPAAFRVDIETNWFRGDDEVARACADHKTDAAGLLKGMELARQERAAKAEGSASC